MDRTILIVEDNQGVASLLKEIAADLGATAVHVRGGSEAISLLTTRAQAGQPPPDAVIVDLVLSELDGFQVATHLRNLAGGDAVPLIVVSGVYKKLPEAFQSAVQPHFMPKPFEPGALRKLLQDELDAADRARGMERGRFLNTTPSELFARLAERRASGLLEIWNSDTRRRLWWQAGQIRFGQSNLRAETAGAMQVHKGEITAAAFDRAVAHARQTKQPLFEALVATRVLSPERLNEALKAQTQEVAIGALGMAGADWLLSEADAEKVPDARRHPLTAIIEHARRSMSAEEARESLLRLEDATVERSPLLERELFVVRNAWPGETAINLVAGQVPLIDLVAKAREEDLPLLWALVSSGLTPASRPAIPSPSSSSSLRSTPPPESLHPRNASDDERKARHFILSERDRTAGFDHYQMLGLARTATSDEVRAAFLKRAREYHADTYANLNLGSATDVLSDLFQRLNTAHETLMNARSRQDYDIVLQRKAEGLPTDVGAVLEAEGVFKKAAALVRSSTQSKMPMALEMLDQAIALNAGDPDFHVYRAYAAYRSKSGNSDTAASARETIRKIQEKAPNLASTHLFLGLIARDLGQDVEAVSHLEKALEIDAADEYAVRELRALRARHRKGGEGTSLLRRLFRK